MRPRLNMFLVFHEIDSCGDDLTIKQLWECVVEDKIRFGLDFHPDPEVDLKRMQRLVSVYKSWDYLTLVKKRKIGRAHV